MEVLVERLRAADDAPLFSSAQLLRICIPSQSESRPGLREAYAALTAAVNTAKDAWWRQVAACMRTVSRGAAARRPGMRCWSMRGLRTASPPRTTPHRCTPAPPAAPAPQLAGEASVPGTIGECMEVLVERLAGADGAPWFGSAHLLQSHIDRQMSVFTCRQALYWPELHEAYAALTAAVAAAKGPLWLPAAATDALWQHVAASMNTVRRGLPQRVGLPPRPSGRHVPSGARQARPGGLAHTADRCEACRRRLPATPPRTTPHLCTPAPPAAPALQLAGEAGVPGTIGECLAVLLERLAGADGAPWFGSVKTLYDRISYQAASRPYLAVAYTELVAAVDAAKDARLRQVAASMRTAAAGGQGGGTDAAVKRRAKDAQLAASMRTVRRGLPQRGGLPPQLPGRHAPGGRGRPGLLAWHALLVDARPAGGASRLPRPAPPRTGALQPHPSPLRRSWRARPACPAQSGSAWRCWSSAWRAPTGRPGSARRTCCSASFPTRPSRGRSCERRTRRC
jgi:hypothetical protein